MHPADTAEGRPTLHQSRSLGYCNLTKCCTKACPEHITITDNAIIGPKDRVDDRYFDPIARILGVFTNK